jgi:type VI secretion system protein ImpK
MRFAAAQSSPDLLPVALRDTARTVASLRSGKPPSLETLRTDAELQIAALREELQRRDLPHDVIDDALYAQCALLDEAALNGLDAYARDAWESEPLQVRMFGRNDAGEDLLRRIDQRLSEPKPLVPLLRIFSAVLKLGFHGRFTRNNPDAHAKLIASIDDCLARAHGVSAGNPSHDQSGPLIVNPLRKRRRPLSPLIWVCIACIATGLVWLTIDRWLQSSIDGIAY